MKRIALILSLGFVSLACAPHKIQYYQLSALPPQPALASAGPIITVGHITSPKALEDNRIRYREGPNEVGTYEYHRWTDPPSILVRDSLVHVLRSSGRFGAVEVASNSAGVDYAVRGKLLEFAEVDGPGIQTRVSLELELHEVKSGRMVWNQVLTHEDPVDAKKVSSVVQSLDRNLNTVLTQASDSIGSYVATHPVASH